MFGLSQLSQIEASLSRRAAAEAVGGSFSENTREKQQLFHTQDQRSCDILNVILIEKLISGDSFRLLSFRKQISLRSQHSSECQSLWCSVLYPDYLCPSENRMLKWLTPKSALAKGPNNWWCCGLQCHLNPRRMWVWFHAKDLSRWCLQVLSVAS